MVGRGRGADQHRRLGTLIKGLFFLLLPANAAGGIALWGVPYERFYYEDVVVALVLGCYLAYQGFSAPRGAAVAGK